MFHPPGSLLEPGWVAWEAEITELLERQSQEYEHPMASFLNWILGRWEEKTYWCTGVFLFLFFKALPSLITFHVDVVNETSQQRLLKYFSALERIPDFHVALVQEFSVTPEKLQYLG